MWSFKVKANQSFQYETYYIWFWIQFKRKSPVISGSFHFMVIVHDPTVNYIPPPWNRSRRIYIRFKMKPNKQQMCVLSERVNRGASSSRQLTSGSGNAPTVPRKKRAYDGIFLAVWWWESVRRSGTHRSSFPQQPTFTAETTLSTFRLCTVRNFCN